MNDKPIEPKRITLLQEVSQIGKHQACLVWPQKLTPDGYGDLEYWLTGVLRKAKRSIASSEEEADKEHEDET